jgi:2-iminobutanoate/2-iminopropanoate deaminase
MRGFAYYLSPLLLVVVLAFPVTAAEQKVISPPGMDTGLPFSPAILSGDFLFLSGSIGNKAGSLEVEGDIRDQTRQAMENLKVILKAADMDFSHVVQTNAFLSDTRYFQAFNEVYRSYFTENPPTRATVQADIVLGAQAEFSMIAVRPGVERKVIIPEGMKTPELPYSWGILAGNTLFIAGATSRNPETYQPVTGDTATQTKQVMENIGRVLKGAGMDYKDVVSCKVFLEDARDFQAMNEVYRTFFPEDPPTRATVRARLMNPAFKAEIQCVAVKDPTRKVVVAEGASRSSSPFSPAIQVGNRLYLSGFVGRGPDGYAPGDVKAQTKQTLANLAATLKAAGMDFTNVVDATVYLSDIRYYQAMNEVYREIMPTPPPPRATIGAQLMSPDALVEIMMVATNNE